MMKFLMTLTAILFTIVAHAQGENVEMADTMRSEGKIYVVVGVILIVLIGMIAYLFLIDNKVKKLEKKLSEKA